MACAQSLSVLSSLLGFIFKWDHNVQVCTRLHKHVQVQIRLSLLGPNNKVVDCRGPNPSKSNKPVNQHHQYQEAIKAEATHVKAKALWQNQRENIAFLLQTSRCTVFTTGLLVVLMQPGGGKNSPHWSRYYQIVPEPSSSSHLSEVQLAPGNTYNLSVFVRLSVLNISA